MTDGSAMGHRPRAGRAARACTELPGLAHGEDRAGNVVCYSDNGYALCADYRNTVGSSDCGESERQQTGSG